MFSFSHVLFYFFFAFLSGLFVYLCVSVYNYVVEERRLSSGEARRLLVKKKDVLFKHTYNDDNDNNDSASACDLTPASCCAWKFRLPSAPPVHHDFHYINHTSSGRVIFTHTITPTTTKPTAILVYCHGFSDHSLDGILCSAVRLSCQGNFIVVLFDHKGHGISDGKHMLIDDWRELVSDTLFVNAYYQQKFNKDGSLRTFLLGESMGGAVGVQIAVNHADVFNGVILLSPMCKISDDMKPHPIVVKIFLFLARWFPELAVAPVPDVVEWCFKRKEILAYMKSHPFYSPLRPRLKTAYQMLDLALTTERVLPLVSVPFLVLHGSDDRVTACDGSKDLLACAQSKDKTLKLYQGGWHNLLLGEPSTTSDVVFADIVNWIQQRN